MALVGLKGLSSPSKEVRYFIFFFFWSRSLRRCQYFTISVFLLITLHDFISLLFLSRGCCHKKENVLKPFDRCWDWEPRNELLGLKMKKSFVVLSDVTSCLLVQIFSYFVLLPCSFLIHWIFVCLSNFLFLSSLFASSQTLWCLFSSRFAEKCTPYLTYTIAWQCFHVIHFYG